MPYAKQGKAWDYWVIMVASNTSWMIGVGGAWQEKGTGCSSSSEKRKPSHHHTFYCCATYYLHLSSTIHVAVTVTTASDALLTNGQAFTIFAFLPIIGLDLALPLLCTIYVHSHSYDAAMPRYATSTPYNYSPKKVSARRIHILSPSTHGENPSWSPSPSPTPHNDQGFKRILPLRPLRLLPSLNRSNRYSLSFQG